MSFITRRAPFGRMFAWRFCSSLLAALPFSFTAPLMMGFVALHQVSALATPFRIGGPENPMRDSSANLFESPRRVRYIPESAVGSGSRRQRAARFFVQAAWFGLILEGMLLLGLMSSIGVGRLLFGVLTLVLTLDFMACLLVLFLRSVVFPDRGFFRPRQLYATGSQS